MIYELILNARHAYIPLDCAVNNQVSPIVLLCEVKLYVDGMQVLERFVSNKYRSANIVNNRLNSQGVT